ncbi:MAG: class I SAM-dependent methyltransferase [Rubrobacteraceae bacterium]
MSTNDYRRSATSYALRGISGTDAVAFRALSERFSDSKLSGRALDLGCGSGRSTRFLKALNFETVGVDVSEAMVIEARKHDPGGEYHVYPAQGQIPFGDSYFDVILSTWVLLELSSKASLGGLLGEAARVLATGGRGFFVTNTADFYRHRWVSCEVDFPENEAPLHSGQTVKARLVPEGVMVTDVFWSDDDYREVLAAAKLRVAHAWHPKAPASDARWLDETRVAPYVIYEVEKTW